jgi:hypothetical protein
VGIRANWVDKIPDSQKLEPKESVRGWSAGSLCGCEARNKDRVASRHTSRSLAKFLATHESLRLGVDVSPEFHPVQRHACIRVKMILLGSALSSKTRSSSNRSRASPSLIYKKMLGHSTLENDLPYANLVTADLGSGLADLPIQMNNRLSFQD